MKVDDADGAVRSYSLSPHTGTSANHLSTNLTVFNGDVSITATTTPDAHTAWSAGSVDASWPKPRCHQRRGHLARTREALS